MPTDAFEHPTDHAYQIEPQGEHPNRQAGVIQHIDDRAISSIVTDFNSRADSGQLSHGSEMLIDHEHFRHDPDKETIAYGWLQRLEARPDGIYGRIRWTGTGQAAVYRGDYRFFSTEYDPADLDVLNGGGNLKHVRPIRLAGLTLTNSPNNKGGRPITNRAGPMRAWKPSNILNTGDRELAVKRFAELALDEQRRTGCSLAAAWLKVQNRESSLSMRAGGPRSTGDCLGQAGDSAAREASRLLLEMATEERSGGCLSLALGRVMNRNRTLARAAGYVFPQSA